MLLKPTLFATLLGSSVAYAQLPQSSEALGAYANHVNSNGSSTPYRPFQVMTNTQQETAPAKPRGFTSRYLGVKYTPQKLKKLRLALSARQLHKMDHNLVASKHQHHNNNPFARISVLFLIPIQLRNTINTTKRVHLTIKPYRVELLL